MDQGPLNILIVDDDIPITLFMKKIVTGEGHRAFVSPNSAKANDVLKAEKINIALCDLVLPGADGSDIIKEIKKSDPNIYCVLFSGYYDVSFDNYKVLVGADEVIGKPVTKETVQAIIQHYFEKRSAS